MYTHQNNSQASGGSARRISLNNPFRQALLADEQRNRSRSNLESPQEDQEYAAWLDRRAREQQLEDDSSDARSFEAGDELDFVPHTAQNGQRSSSNPFSRPNKPEKEAPPPAYHDVVPKTKQRDYSSDEKNPNRVSVEEIDENPFPENLRQPPPAPNGSNRGSKEGRIRSKSTGDNLDFGKRSNRDHAQHGQHRSHRSSREHREDGDRPHRSQSHSHGTSSHRRSHRSRRFVQEKSKQVDTIDRLDVTGFFGGAKFHHDGPFDACTPQRNKSTKVAPVAAFPADGPNNSIKGVQPNVTKDDQYNMMFGVDSAAHNGRAGAAMAHSNNSSSNMLMNREVTPGSRDSVDTMAGALQKARISQLDLTNGKRLVGEESAGLGATTFMDGAPVAEKTQREKEASGDLGRKKTLLGRMKTIVRK